MPTGDKSKYTDKQKRQAAHIEESYEKRGTSEKRPKRLPGLRSTRNLAAGKNPAQAEPMPSPSNSNSNSNSNSGSARRSSNRALWMARSL